jgi:hypothetical protein
MSIEWMVAGGVTFVVWLIRLEGRVNTHERGCEVRQREIENRLERIEDKLDRAIESR